MTAIDSATAAAPQAGIAHAPADFLVTWEQPGDELRSWTQERWSIPGPISPLAFAFVDLMYSGINAAAAAYALPTRVMARRINAFVYLTEYASALPADVAEQGQRSEQLLDAALTALGERWAGDWLPEVQQHLTYWDGFDLRGATAPGLLEHLDETIARLQRVWAIHFLLFNPLVLAISEFDELYRDLMGSEGNFDSYRLLQGFDNRTLDGDLALWELSRKALASPEVLRVLRESAPGQVQAALEASPATLAFLTELRTYLAEYGQRTNDVARLNEPSWIEDPAPVMTMLQDYLAQPTRDLVAERAALADERERCIAAVRERLAGYPAPLADRFEFLLRTAQQAVVLSEDHGFWIDQRCQYRARVVSLEVGHRLVGFGAIDAADDVFYLTMDDLRAALVDGTARDLRSRVAAYRAEVLYFRSISPPPTLGVEPSEAAPAPDTIDLLGRAMGKFMGTAPAAATHPDTIAGIAGSPGSTRGTARVILSLADAGRLEPGDILVTEYTQQSWTPLFGVAAALVTDFGGVLSHCAIVAREYGLPAVVGTGTATTTLLDGQIIEVDGDRGIVRIIANP